MTLEDRQRQAAYDWTRSSYIPPTSPARAKLDLALLQAERDRQQRKYIDAMEAELSGRSHVRIDCYYEAGRGPYFKVTPMSLPDPDLIAFAKRGEVKEQE
jgi:hypothetical protein